MQNYAVLGAKWIRLLHTAPPLNISIHILHSPSANNPPRAFIHYSGKQFHLLCYPLSSHPPRYGTSTPAPTPFLSDRQKPSTNDTSVSRWLFNDAVNYRSPCLNETLIDGFDAKRVFLYFMFINERMMRRSCCLSVCFISKPSTRIVMKFGTGDLH
jgi:hypothetical protein